MLAWKSAYKKVRVNCKVYFEKVVDKRYSGAIQYDQVEKLSTHKIRQDVFRKEDVLPSPHKDSIPADFVSAGFLFVHDNNTVGRIIYLLKKRSDYNRKKENQKLLVGL